MNVTLRVDQKFIDRLKEINEAPESATAEEIRFLVGIAAGQIKTLLAKDPVLDE